MTDINTKLKLSYGLGGFGKNIAYGLVASYILYYYNEVLGISASFVGLLLMIARIFDALNDPFMGIVVAKTNSRFGRYRPWILIGAVLNAVIMVFMFSVPVSLSMSHKKIYVAVTYFLCGITYTLSDIPYWSVIPAITRPGRERESLTLFARSFSGIGAALPTVVTMFLVALLGGGGSRAAYRSGFFRLAVIVAVLYVLTTIITVRNLREKEVSEQKSVTISDMLSALVKNDYAMAIALIIVLFNSAIYMTTNLGLYIYQYDVGNEAQYSIYMAIMGIVQLVAMTGLYPYLRRFMDNRRIFLISCLIGAAGYAFMLVLGFFGSYNLYTLSISGVLVAVANGMAYVLTTIFIAGAVDYGEKMTGHREDSVVSSLQTLMVKVSSAIAVFIAGIGIDLVGIVKELDIQSASVKFNLRLLYSLPELLLMALAFYVFYRRKNLGKDVK